MSLYKDQNINERFALFTWSSSSILQVHLAINRLGLSTISPFNPKERVALIILDLDMYESIS